MKLSDLAAYNPITVQCHDNPDADALASGYALYTLKNPGKTSDFCMPEGMPFKSQI